MEECMKNPFRSCKIREATLKKVRVDCKNEFLRAHPEFKNIPITDTFIIDRIASYYIQDEVKYL